MPQTLISLSTRAASVELLGYRNFVYGKARFTGKTMDSQHSGTMESDHGQNGNLNVTLLCQRDAQTKSDQADSALEEGVAHTGQGPISEVLTALMVSGLKFSRSAAYCSSMEAARPSVKALVCGVQL